MPPPLFSAGRIASALGKTKRAVSLALSNTAPAGVVIERGQQANGWRPDQFSLRMMSDLETRARKMGFRNAEHLLADAPKRFVPRDCHGAPLAIGDIAEHHIDRADRFRRALSLTFQLKDDLGAAESKKAAISAFRRELGAYASEKTWSRWFSRVLRRDAGEERFYDLKLYFDDVVARKHRARVAIPVAITADDRTLLDALDAIAAPGSPTLDQMALVWATCCEVLNDLVANGEKLQSAQTRVLNLIQKSGVAMARTPEALRKNLKRKYKRWKRGGETFTALEDQRPHRTGNHQKAGLSDSDRHKLIGHAVVNCGGRVSQGYRELRDRSELSEGLLRRNIADPASKSYVPTSIRRAVAHDIRRLEAIDRGPREHKLRGAYHTRDWSGVAAGDWFQADDLTPPVYFWKIGTSGHVELRRGQFLPMIDERTSFILGFVLIQSRNYNSLSIRSLITSICAEHGLPRRGFSFERGLWQTSRILSGDRREIDMNGIADTGLRRLGMRMRHAILPRAKVIERTLGQLQDMMECLPGYCGRNEVTKKEERFARLKLDIEAGRVEASDHVLNVDDLARKYSEICAAYNDAPQQGRLNGLCPREAWERLQGEEPRARFNDATHYFLASDLRRLKVGRNGIAFKIGKQEFRYKGEETGKRRGEFIYAWFNPQRPAVLPCSMNVAGDDIFVVERSYEIPAVDAPAELLASENEKIAAHNRYAQDLYHVVRNILPPSMFRGQTLDRKGLRFGREIESQTQRIISERRSEEQLDRSISVKARKARLSPVLVNRSPEALEILDEYAAANAELNRKLEK